MKIKLTNLIEGVNTAAPAITSTTTQATTQATTPGTTTTLKSNETKKSASWWDNYIPDAVKGIGNAGTVIGGALGYITGGVRGAIAGAAIGNEISGAVSGKQETKNEPAKNQEHIDRHNDYLARTQRKLERDRLTRQAEVEAATHSARMARIARSKQRIFEQHSLQFKPNTLKSLLEGGIVSDTLNYFTPTTSPKIAAKRFIDITTPQPGENSYIRDVKSLFGRSPATWAKIEGGRVASAAAFDPSIGAEKIKHYANIIQATDPYNLASTVATGIGRAAQYELRNRLYYGFDTGKRPLSSAGLGTLGAVAGAVGGVGGLVAPYTEAKAKIAARMVAAQKDDWRYAALPS